MNSKTKRLIALEGTPMLDCPDISKNLLHVMEQSGLSNSKFCQRISMAPSQVTQMKNKGQNPRFHHLINTVRYINGLKATDPERYKILKPYASLDYLILGEE